MLNYSYILSLFIFFGISLMPTRDPYSYGKYFQLTSLYVCLKLNQNGAIWNDKEHLCLLDILTPVMYDNMSCLYHN